MADKSRIEWTDATWNPLRGCSRVSEGCRHCYAEGVAARFSGLGLPYEGLAKRVTRPDGGSEARWTGKVVFSGEEVLTQPLRWKKPRKIFVNSMSDLFHESVPDEWIDRIFAVMALCPQHTFQVLTKRPERMRAYLAPFDGRRADGLGMAVVDLGYQGPMEELPWPLPNVWLGVSVEDQVTADTRIPYLLQTPAAVRFMSAEPLLGPMDLGWLEVSALERADVLQGKLHGLTTSGSRCWTKVGMPRLDWVIAGGESGAGARPMHPNWARSLRDQCATAGVPYFFKQFGEWAPVHSSVLPASGPGIATVLPDGRVREWQPDYPEARLTSPDMRMMERLGKARAGRLLDGVEHNGMPA